MCLKKMADVVFFRQNPAMNSPLHRARGDSAAISRSCHCIIGERLPRLRAEGQVQGLRSVTPLQCLSFITTLKTATHPCVFCPPPPSRVFMPVKWWHCVTTWHVDIVLTLGRGRKGHVMSGFYCTCLSEAMFTKDSALKILRYYVGFYEKVWFILMQLWCSVG